MKLTRVVLLAVALVVSVLAAPEAFGAKRKDGPATLRHSSGPRGMVQACAWLEIGCNGDLCCGSLAACAAYCDAVCGEPCAVPIE